MRTVELFSGTRSFSKVAAPRGAKTGTQGLKGSKDRSRIPPEIFDEIFDLLENKI